MGKIYWVWGWVSEDQELDAFYSKSLSEAKRFARKINQSGSCQIKEYEGCFNEYGELIQRADDPVAVFEDDLTRVSML